MFIATDRHHQQPRAILAPAPHAISAKQYNFHSVEPGSAAAYVLNPATLSALAASNHNHHNRPAAVMTTGGCCHACGCGHGHGGGSPLLVGGQPLVIMLQDHKPILAERFKTKMCKNFIEHGYCPYVYRCMFAHGDHELRTKQMNLEDGLTSEEAIKAFKRAAYEAEKQAEQAKYDAIIVLASGRTRHDPYAQRTAWHPLSSSASGSGSSGYAASHCGSDHSHPVSPANGLVDA